MAQREGMSTTKNFQGVRHPSDTYRRVVERNRSRGDLCELPGIVRDLRGKVSDGCLTPKTQLLFRANRGLTALLTAQVDDRKRFGPANYLGAGDATTGTDDGAGRRTFGHGSFLSSLDCRGGEKDSLPKAAYKSLHINR